MVLDYKGFTEEEIQKTIDWKEMQDLFSYLKSPAHKIGSVLNSYKFISNRGGGKKKYLLSKQNVETIINLYFNTNKIPHNPTISTQQHKQHIITQTTPENKITEGNVGLCGVCGIMGKAEDNIDPLPQFSPEEQKIIQEQGLTPEQIQTLIKARGQEQGNDV